MGPEHRDLLPVACTLGPADGAERLADWRRIVQEAGAGHVWTTGMVTLLFRDGAGVGNELHRLVSAERDCCAFVSWHVAQAGQEWRVEISGSDDELRSLTLAL